jgi:hypothetical protein
MEFARESDVPVVARLDRLARSIRQLLSTADALQARSIGLRPLHENTDTTSATHLRRPRAIRGGASACAHPDCAGSRAAVVDRGMVGTGAGGAGVAPLD